MPRAGRNETTHSVRRADARRNERKLLEAAATVFLTTGVDAPIRDIAAEAGVGTATIYRHFPHRADLVIAVYKHQVEQLADAGPTLLLSNQTALEALRQWIDQFVGFLVTKRGLAAVLQADEACYDPLHDYFLDTLVPVCATLLSAVIQTERVDVDIDARMLMRGVASLCVGADVGRGGTPQLVHLLLTGLSSA